MDTPDDYRRRGLSVPRMPPLDHALDLPPGVVTLTQALVEAVECSIQRGCVLCGKPAAVAGVFVPDDPAAFGAAPGKSRAVCYSLCAMCYTRPGGVQAAEERIRRELRT
jgi:hypothetical protein